MAEKKKCIGCMDYLPVDKFNTGKRKLKDGTIKTVIRPRCKPCERAYSKAWREKKKEEGVYAEINRRYEENRKNKDPLAYKLKKKELYIRYREKNADEIRRRNRENAAIRRRKEGRPIRGPWKKYSRHSNKEVSTKPLADFLEKLPITSSSIALRADLHVDYIRKIRKSNKSTSAGIKKITEDTVDKILIAIDREDQFNILYPVEE